MSKTSIKLLFIPLSLLLFTFNVLERRFSGSVNPDTSNFNQNSPLQYQKPKQKNTTSHTIRKELADTTFILKIENEKRVVDEALKTKLIRELKAVIAKHHLKKPYKIAMGFTKGARDVETFHFGEQIFYTLAESGFTINGTPLDMPEMLFLR